MFQKHKKTLGTIALSLIAVVFFFSTSNAQVITSSITGRVLDGQSNVVPGAKVVITNRATGAERTVTTNSSGEYVVTNLPPGRYDVAVEAQSFSRALIEDVEINVGSRQNVNFSLQPGNIEETVTITTTPPLVETTRSELDTSISPKEIENLPLLNRTFAGLSVIAPEARPVGTFDPTKTRVGTIAFSGGDGRQVNVNVDGGDNKDNVVGSLLQNFSYESIQEFQVNQHGWTADQGRSVGGVVNVITKSGGNSLRGSFFSNFRHDSLQNRDFFDKLGNRDNPDFQRQEIGGSIGGPIVTDRAFFFFALERFRERQFTPVHPTAVAQLQAIPGVQFVEEIPTPYDDTLLSAKIDHTLNSKQSMFYRFSFQDNNSPNDQVTNPARTDLSGGNTTNNRLYSLAVNHTYNIRPTVLNQFIFHFQDFVNEILPNSAGLTLNFPAAGVSIGQNANTPQSTKERKFQFRDDISWIKGKHAMKFGVNYIHTILDGYFYFGTQGYSLTFRFSPTDIMASGGFNQDDLLQSLTYSDGASSHYQKLDQLAFYFQDDWKITRKLTLNLGLRWDANIGNLPRQDQNRTMVILSQLNHPLAQALTGDIDKLRRKTPNWTEYQPRVGFAYDPWGDGKTVIRGGYGIFYDQLFQNLTLFSDVQSQPHIFQPAINWTRPHPDLTTFRYGTSQLPTVDPNFDYSNLAPGSFGRINDPDATEPYVQKWSIGFQREINRSWSVSSDYVHTLGLHEPRFLNINPLISTTCNAAYGGDPDSPLCPRGAATRLLDTAFVAAGLGPGRLNQINMFATNNRSMFDSWTTTLKYRTGRMLFNASYVLSSSRSWGGQPTASYSGNGIAITPENQFKPEEFGPTRMDERHRIVLSGVFNLPWDFQVSPIIQYASARPFSPTAGIDIDGDGLAFVDRLCAGVNPMDVYNAVRNRPLVPNPNPSAPPGSMILQPTGDAVRALNPFGCTQARVNDYRGGLIIDSDGNITGEKSGGFFNADLRVTKLWRFGERFRLSTYLDLYNLFDKDNLAFAQRLGVSAATGAGNTARAPEPGFNGAPQSSSTFLTPFSLFGPGFGPPVGRPFTAQLGFRFTF